MVLQSAAPVASNPLLATFFASGMARRRKHHSSLVRTPQHPKARSPKDLFVPSSRRTLSSPSGSSRLVPSFILLNTPRTSKQFSVPFSNMIHHSLWPAGPQCSLRFQKTSSRRQQLEAWAISRTSFLRRRSSRIQALECSSPMPELTPCSRVSKLAS